MSDRELLEAAARAAGVDYHIDRLDGCPKLVAGGRIWNPLVDDGDALRLAVKLRMELLHSAPGESVPWVSAVVKNTMIHAAEDCQSEDQRQAAARRAIVRAAAALAGVESTAADTGDISPAGKPLAALTDEQVRAVKDVVWDWREDCDTWEALEIALHGIGTAGTTGESNG